MLGGLQTGFCGADGLLTILWLLKGAGWKEKEFLRDLARHLRHKPLLAWSTSGSQLAPALTQNDALKMSMAVQEFFREKVLTVDGVEEALRRDIGRALP